jgi:hypothetical protein
VSVSIPGIGLQRTADTGGVSPRLATISVLIEGLQTDAVAESYHLAKERPAMFGTAVPALSIRSLLVILPAIFYIPRPAQFR